MSTDDDGHSSGLDIESNLHSDRVSSQNSSTVRRSPLDSLASLDKSNFEAEIFQSTSGSPNGSLNTEYLYKDENGTLIDDHNITKLRELSLKQQNSFDWDASSINDGETEFAKREMSREQHQESSNISRWSASLQDSTGKTPSKFPLGKSVKEVKKTQPAKKKVRKHRTKNEHRASAEKSALEDRGYRRWARKVDEGEKRGEYVKETYEGDSSSEGEGMQRGKRIKRKVISAQEKELHSQVRKLAASPRLFRAFQQKMGEWMTQNYGRIIDLFRRFDADQSGNISYDEFFAGMKHLGAPATEAEMYLVATTLDTDNDNVIDYHEFAKLRRQYRACSGTFQKAADLPSPEMQSMVQQQYLQPCPGCGLGLWQPVDEDMPRFVLLSLGCLSFQDIKGFPESFCVEVQSETSIYGVSRLVKKELGPCVMNITIYRPRDGGEKELLSPEKKLSDYGFCGSLPPEPPEKVTLMYDYVYPFLDCPLLMADFQLKPKDEVK